MRIVPAILTGDVIEARQLMDEVWRSGRFEKVQVDFVDGKYANNLTIRPDEIDLTPYLSLDFEAHLMVTQTNVDEYKKMAIKIGFDKIIAQVESISKPEEFECLALDIHSPVEAIVPYLPRLKKVVLMAIEPGFGGQKLDIAVFEKLKELGKYKIEICVDGGVEQEHLEILEKLGVSEIAVGAKRVLQWK